jgi:lysophospholipase L1-like esterase
MGRTTRIAGLAALVLGMLIPAASAAASQYAALGDSYSSGVGTRVFYEESGGCDRSPDAYGPKIAAKHSYTLNFEACGGAKTPEVIEKQLGKLTSSTALVTITIGGNDAGFSNVMLNCALYYFTCGSAISEANSYIEKTLPGKLETTYKDIRAKATTAEVIVLGYPKLFTKEGTTCNVNFLTSGNEKKMNESAEKLDAVIKKQAEARSFKFVNPTSAFEAHAVCAKEEWLNGQSNPLSESYHPNVKGQEEFTTLVNAAI